MSRGRLHLLKVHRQELKSVVQQGWARRIGVTINPARRMREYINCLRRFIGAPLGMLYALTTNCRQAENTLLKYRNSKLNKQALSNAPEKRGYVYVIL